ncbi:hypothetical protein [Psychroserpens burtonensis]|uniref:hypothetical protein n=1 Tax=Psychroserpens burtonensis TaxID=49278 RepID=UPI00040C30E9|nr:hypothetical protein [Psychroserpens burtonensis]
MIFRYDKKQKRISAFANKPVLVKNEDLQYLVSFEIGTFSIDFSYVNLETKDFVIKSVFYKGTSFYTPLEGSQNIKAIKNRQKAYKGSLLHFMRALSKQNLKEEKYSIASGGFLVNPEKYISVSKIDSNMLFKVKLRAPLSVLYKNKLQSDITSPKIYNYRKQKPKKKMPFKDGDTLTPQLLLKTFKKKKEAKTQNPCFNTEFFIDNFGNYNPIEAFSLIGYMADLRVGDSLPLDYSLEVAK